MTVPATTKPGRPYVPMTEARFRKFCEYLVQHLGVTSRAAKAATPGAPMSTGIAASFLAFAKRHEWAGKLLRDSYAEADSKLMEQFTDAALGTERQAVSYGEPVFVTNPTTGEKEPLMIRVHDPRLLAQLMKARMAGMVRAGEAGFEGGRFDFSETKEVRHSGHITHSRDDGDSRVYLTHAEVASVLTPKMRDNLLEILEHVSAERAKAAREVIEDESEIIDVTPTPMIEGPAEQVEEWESAS